MKHIVIVALFASLAMASDAHALKITNLDTVPHTVEYDSAGAPEVAVVQPNQSVHFHGRPDGFLSLKAPSGTAKKSVRESDIHADGILSGIVGAARSERIPASANYDFVIWPGGRLRIQNHRNGNIF